MENTRSFENSQILYAPVNLAAIGIVDNRHVAMRVEEMDRAGLFLISKEYVRPRALFQVELYLSDDEAPIHAIMTATFVERTWEGYGIAAELSCISLEARSRWSSYYRRAIVDSTPGYSATFQFAKFLKRQHVAVMAGALSEAARSGLREQGVEVTMVWTAEEAMRLSQSGEVSLVILAEKDPQYDGAALCRALAAAPWPPLVMMMIEHGAMRSFEGWLYAGATKVVARKCSAALIVTRVLALLQHPHTAEDESAELLPLPAIQQEPATSSVRSMFARFMQSAMQRLQFFPQAGGGL